MSSAPAARTYAKALMEASGTDAPKVADELDAVADIAVSAPAEWAALVAPNVSAGVRKTTIDRLLSDSHVLTRNVLKVLTDNGRFGETPELATEFRKLVQERERQLDVHVTTAVDLSTELKTKLEKSLSDSTGKHVTLHTSVDPEIIGGLVVRHGDTLVDTSLKGRLESLRLSLSKPTPRTASAE